VAVAVVPWVGYKLVELAGQPKLKLTADREKSSIPGRKQLWRVVDGDGRAFLDLLSRDGELPSPGAVVTDPTNPLRRTKIPSSATWKNLRQVMMANGQVLEPQPSLTELQQRAKNQLQQLPQGALRLLNPHIYRVSLSEGLLQLRSELIQQLEATF
jgi:nicotinate phosphoribosyltransferase